MAELTQNLKYTRGDTFFSPKWYFTNETVPEGISSEDFLAGLQDGTYTLLDLTEFTIESQMRLSPDTDVIIDITPYIVTTGDVLSFTIPASETEALPNSRKTYIYDIQFTHNSEGYVRTMIAGNMVQKTETTQSGGLL